MNLHQKAQAHLEQGEYAAAAALLETAVASEPTDVQHYLSLGLTYLLLGNEAEAQTTWLCGMAQAEDAAMSRWSAQLAHLLDDEAEHQFAQTQLRMSWLLRRHLREVAPQQINNLLKLLSLELQLAQFDPKVLTEWEIIPALQQTTPSEINPDLLLQVLEQLLKFYDLQVLAFAQASTPLLFTHSHQLVAILHQAAENFANLNTHEHYGLAIDLVKLILTIQPPDKEILGLLWGYYRKISDYDNEVITAQKFYGFCSTLAERFSGSWMLLDAYLRAGKWLEIEPIAEQYHQLMTEMATADLNEIDLISVKRLLFNISLYLKDDLGLHGALRNQSARIFEQRLRQSFVVPNLSNRASISCRLPLSEHKLKIGFLSHTLRNHSVGWLSRWLFKYLDRNRFAYSIYLQRMEPSDTFFQKWFAPYVDTVCDCPDYVEQTAHAIANDQIDILIDLDGPTLDIAASVLSLKAAPIQATWLGWDAIGLPSMDYFIADPYVLPDYAQEHYQEKVLRLPRTYIAVEGFEADVPDLRRSDLNIPTNAIVYYSSQRAIKQHPEVIEAQMQIIKAVSNSYLLIKGGFDLSINQDYFIHMADKVGVSLDRVRFLGRAENEFIHRANMRVADVVLDTFPYNGATTTLEALWMGLPLVTKVGEQFTARYSYAFLKNVGVEEGIAYTNEEYVEWGIRLGTDERLRRQVAWKLRQSRRTSPLWNAKQFARDMENAFLQMWQEHLLKVAS